MYSVDEALELLGSGWKKNEVETLNWSTGGPRKIVYENIFSGERIFWLYNQAGVLTYSNVNKYAMSGASIYERKELA